MLFAGPLFAIARTRFSIDTKNHGLENVSYGYLGSYVEFLGDIYECFQK